MQIAPYFRRYELPWNPADDSERGYRRMQRAALVLLLLFGILIPLLPRVESPKKTTADLPERVVQLIVEKPLPPPPPPPPVKPPEPTVKPEPRPAPIRPVKPQDVREKVRQVGLLAMQDQLADLRQKLDPKDLAKTDLNKVAEDVRSERNLITSKVGAASSGINTASLSRGYGGGAGAIGTHTTATVAAPSNVSGSGSSGVQRTGNSGKAARSREEIETVFDRNKGALYALYTRAQRENPELQGKLVLELTISPAGEVTAARIISSELKDPDLERKIIARVRLFRFEPKDVEAITATKPIDFFPA
jgi:TonB family protein